jgi:hypothetical protein
VQWRANYRVDTVCSDVRATDNRDYSGVRVSYKNFIFNISPNVIMFIQSIRLRGGACSTEKMRNGNKFHFKPHE